MTTGSLRPTSASNPGGRYLPRFSTRNFISHLTGEVAVMESCCFPILYLAAVTRRLRRTENRCCLSAASRRFGQVPGAPLILQPGHELMCGEPSSQVFFSSEC
jgi:hypothetical protein